jgi:hypothetical protein
MIMQIGCEWIGHRFVSAVFVGEPGSFTKLFKT